MYNEAVNKIQLFEVRVKRLRDGGSGVDADPDVLMAASSLAKEMEYSLSISTPSGPEKTGTFIGIYLIGSLVKLLKGYKFDVI